MGKGLAYQFKQRYPQTFQSYREACLTGALRPGQLHHYQEDGKLVINFPTKDRWRNSSRVEYVEDGLTKLALLIPELQIKSIAIPPLGCGLGGLAWPEIRPMIEKKLAELAGTVEIYIYGLPESSDEPSVQGPTLNASALALMELMEKLERQDLCTPLRVQLTSYFTNVYAQSAKEFFKFSRPRSQEGPYSLEVERLGKSIREYMVFYDVQTAAEARDILYKKLVSKTVNDKLAQLRPAMEKACAFTGGVSSDRELACLASACFAVQRGDGPMRADDVEQVQQSWPKAARVFSYDELADALERLYAAEILDQNLLGFLIAE